MPLCEPCVFPLTLASYSWTKTKVIKYQAFDHLSSMGTHGGFSESAHSSTDTQSTFSPRMTHSLSSSMPLSGEHPHAYPLSHRWWEQGGHLYSQTLHSTPEVRHDALRAGEAPYYVWGHLVLTPILHFLSLNWQWNALSVKAVTHAIYIWATLHSLYLLSYSVLSSSLVRVWELRRIIRSSALHSDGALHLHHLSVVSTAGMCWGRGEL